ncbi:MAG: hypothetical protein HQK52_07945 [Oligoflexia bacterium]|nr:hypothetical protein [Oligoflexia bacterium]
MTFEQTKIGNVVTDSLIDLWSISPQFLSLRELLKRPVTDMDGCGSCSSNKKCAGGCRGEALFMSGDILGRTARCADVTDARHMQSKL